jgi:TrmH family RNA methyltransferase
MALDPEIVRSRSNPALKRVGAILAGKELGALVLEGDRLVDDARAGGHRLELVLVAADRTERAEQLAAHAGQVRLVEPGLLDRASSLKTSPGVIAITPTPVPLDPAMLAPGPRDLVLVVAGVADPGNLGALARSAEAAGARAIVCLDGGASPWSPRALRGSMGSLLRLPVAYGLDAPRAATLLAERGWRSVTAAPSTGPAPSRCG